jgi:secreted trypsin-like serine protease
LNRKLWEFECTEGIYCCTDLTAEADSDDHDLRITNGYTADRGQFPWQAGLEVDGSSFCGGSVISDLWVLTAAHCT